MANKQVIIDRVNVAGCVRLQDDEISCDLGGECKGWKNCYYKQLKCKEQECEKLKEEIKTNGFGCFNIEMSEQLDQLKADNEMLRDELRFYKDFYYAHN